MWFYDGEPLFTSENICPETIIPNTFLHTLVTVGEYCTITPRHQETVTH